MHVVLRQTTYNSSFSQRKLCNCEMCQIKLNLKTAYNHLSDPANHLNSAQSVTVHAG